jgi:hypothetical protein
MAANISTTDTAANISTAHTAANISTTDTAANISTTDTTADTTTTHTTANTTTTHTTANTTTTHTAADTTTTHTAAATVTRVQPQSICAPHLENAYGLLGFSTDLACTQWSIDKYWQHTPDTVEIITQLPAGTVPGICTGRTAYLVMSELIMLLQKYSQNHLVQPVYYARKHKSHSVTAYTYGAGCTGLFKISFIEHAGATAAPPVHCADERTIIDTRTSALNFFSCTRIAAPSTTMPATITLIAVGVTGGLALIGVILGIVTLVRQKPKKHAYTVVPGGDDTTVHID